MLTEIKHRLAGLEFGARSVPLVLLGLCLVTYGLWLFGMGFYWDDWPWVWFAHVSGPQGMLTIDQLHRPLSGVILWIGSLIAGDTPFAWQLLNLLYRWLTGLALWWALLKIWPRQVERTTWVAILFLVYPGFQQQFISINSSRHILPLAAYFLSLGFMVWAVRERTRYLRFTAISLVFGLATMLSTEYYYGLELIRPLVLWLFLAEQSLNRTQRLKQVLRYWAPFLGALLVMFTWRYLVSQRVNYAITFTDELSRSPSQTLLNTLKTLVVDFVETGFAAWAQILDLPDPSTFGRLKTLLYTCLALGSAALVAAYLYWLRDPDPGKRIWKQLLLLGFAALLVAGLPFLVTDIEVGLGFPANRTTLPMMFGASLLLVGLLDGLTRQQKVLKILVVALLAGFAVGLHYQSAVSFQRDWKAQLSLLQQLTWRAPQLEPGTAIFTLDPPDSISTDNSLNAALNWIYAPGLSGQEMPLMMFDLKQRLGTKVPALEKGLPIEVRYGDFTFHGSTDQVLVLYYAPPACLRVLQPRFDSTFPGLPKVLAEALPLTKFQNIDANPPVPAALPAAFPGEAPAPGWCYYFQKADLARQQGNWQQVVELGETAFQLNDSPNHASERVPFIQGYAHTGQWAQAVALTHETMAINKLMTPMLCAVWEDLATSTPEAAQKTTALQQVQRLLDCPAEPAH